MPPPQPVEPVPQATPTADLLNAYTPIPTYAPPLYIPQPEEIQPGPTEVATPVWVAQWRGWLPSMKRVYVDATNLSGLTSRRYIWAQRVDRALTLLWRWVPSLFCLALAFVLFLLRLIVAYTQHTRRRGTPRRR